MWNRTGPFKQMLFLTNAVTHFRVFSVTFIEYGQNINIHDIQRRFGKNSLGLCNLCSPCWQRTITCSNAGRHTFHAQTLTFMSCWFPTLTMYLLLGENATQEMPYLCVWSSATCLRSATSHSLTAGRWPLWWKGQRDVERGGATTEIIKSKQFIFTQKKVWFCCYIVSHTTTRYISQLSVYPAF